MDNRVARLAVALMLGFAAELVSAQESCLFVLGKQDGQPIRDLLGVNAGPLMPLRQGEKDHTAAFQSLGVTKVRTHDYYGPMDMSVLYPDQSADPNDMNSYNFTQSDRVFQSILNAGFEPYLRLGDSWNIGGRYGKVERRAPKNPENWVKACLVVTRHFVDLAKGRLKYVEIWNEPDHPRFWDASDRDFDQLFSLAARSLKEEFPELLVGGPGFAFSAVAFPKGRERVKRFLSYLQQNQVPLDFLSWHIYSNRPDEVVEAARFYRQELDKRGFEHVETHVTEYHTDTHRPVANLSPFALRVDAPGAALLTATWIVLQQEGVAQAFVYRGADAAMDNPTFYGLLRGNGSPKKTGLAFSLWAEMLKCDQRRDISVQGVDNHPLWLLAGTGTDGQNRILVSNPSKKAFKWRIDTSQSPKDVPVTIKEISDAFDAIRVQTSHSAHGIIPPYSVQLISLRPH